jgi:hypothetical protein
MAETVLDGATTVVMNGDVAITTTTCRQLAQPAAPSLLSPESADPTRRALSRQPLHQLESQV